MFSLVSRIVIGRPRLVLLGWLALIAVLHYLAPPWERIVQDDDPQLVPADSPSVIGRQLFERGFPEDASSSDLVLIHERKNGRLTPDDFRFVDFEASSLSEFAHQHPELGINKIDTYRSPVIGPKLIGSSANGPGQAVLSMVSLCSTHLSQKTQVAVDRLLKWVNAEAIAAPPGLSRFVTGSAVVGRDNNTATRASVENATNTTIALVIVLLVCIYRSPLLAMIPLVTIGFSVFGSLRLIALLTQVPGLELRVMSLTQIFVVVVLFGAGTDYCLFVVGRYREELGHGKPRFDALRDAICKVGGALFASAATVIVGLGMLGFSSFASFRCTGPLVALSLAVALVAALTATPAMLAWLRLAHLLPFAGLQNDVGTYRQAKSGESRPMSGFWVRVADAVVKYPLTVFALCLTVLTPLAVVGALSQSNFSQLADLDEDWPSVAGASAVRRYFAIGELSPTVALIEHPTLNFRSPQGRAAIEAISDRLAAIPGVAEVRSLTRPVGKPERPEPGKGLLRRLVDGAVRSGAESRHVATKPRRAAGVDHITRLEIVFSTDPFSESSLQTLELVRTTLSSAAASGQPLQGTTEIGIGGSTSAISDLKRVTLGDQHRMYVR
jgi:RND superfamily putative drug exporter